MHSLAKVLSGPAGVDIFSSFSFGELEGMDRLGEVAPLSPAKADDLGPRVSGT